MLHHNVSKSRCCDQTGLTSLVDPELPIWSRAINAFKQLLTELNQLAAKVRLKLGHTSRATLSAPTAKICFV